MNLIPHRRETGPEVAGLSPFRGLFDLHREMNDLFDSFSLGRWADREEGLFQAAWKPAVDVRDSKENLVVTADLPGLRKEDIDVSIQDGVLIIRGEKKEEAEHKEKGAVRTERFYGSFHRAVSLPTAVDDTKVKASYKNGVLELTLPKKEASNSKRIAIE